MEAVPAGDLAGNIFEVQCLPIKVSVDLCKKTYSCRFWKLNGLPCRHACAALAYQNRRPKEYVNNWLTVGAYNKTYEFLVQPVPSKEFWEMHGYANIFPPAYKRPRGRPTVKRNKRNDAPEPQPNPHRVKRKYGPIVCQYCLIAGHNSRTCQKKDNMAAPEKAGPAAVPDAAPTAVLDAAQAAPAAPVTVPSMMIPNPDSLIPPQANQPPIQLAPIRPPPIRPSMRNIFSDSKRPTKRKNTKRPPPTLFNNMRPPSISNPSSRPIVSQETMHGASARTSTRFMQYIWLSVSSLLRGGGVVEGEGEGIALFGCHLQRSPAKVPSMAPKRDQLNPSKSRTK
ncbi:hypothetical protein Ahy_A06g026027 [Arachis hypogaea]|uniref:SWIM-type domain-containing protein n=1 Tax=Arachis hypogaea TaxID=3818 RepID=A0A445CJ82_ARAHY|nr:hypothetical protein Ahy_A06g026027 [Arachis hypogaea]